MDGFELRILDGPQRGARTTVETGVPFVVGAMRDDDDAVASCDIVLSDPAGADAADGVDPRGHARARVTIDRRDALLEVLDGEIELDGRRYAAGGQVAWSIHTPLRIGAATVAFGRGDVECWPAGAEPASTGASATATSGDSPPLAASRARLMRRPEAWLAATGSAVLLACTGSLFAAHRIAAAPPADPRQLAIALQSDGFPGVSATTGADGRIEIHGRVGTQAERRGLDAWLAERGARFGSQPLPRLDVQVDERVLRDVVEVFRVNDIPVQARITQAGRVEAEAAERDTDRLARAEQVVRRDVRGLEKLTVVNTAPPEAPAPPPVIDDPNKRIASLVPAPAAGGAGYIVTADGARYFVGALLPSGYRIAQIEPQRLQLERDGRQSTLNF
jgi:type III secretion protein D